MLRREMSIVYSRTEGETSTGRKCKSECEAEIWQKDKEGRQVRGAGGQVVGSCPTHLYLKIWDGEVPRPVQCFTS